MRLGFWLLLGGCADAVCPPSTISDVVATGVRTCALAGEPCDRDTACAMGTDCVPVLMCTAGPCPGVCRVGCGDDHDCGSSEVCDVPDGHAADERYCLPGG